MAGAVAAIASASSAAMSSMRGRMRATARAVNAPLSSLRRRVWSGGSELSMWVLSESLNGMCPLPERPLPRRISANRALSFESSGSVSAARASSYRVISQTSTPSGLVTLVTGWVRRSSW